VSIDIVTEWLRLPYSMVDEIETFSNHTDLRIRRTPPALSCSGCGQLCFDRYDRTVQRIRDLNVFELHSYLVLTKWRVHCPNCGVRVEDVGFADPYSRYTHRFEEFVFRMCRHTPIANVAETLGLNWKTVKEIDKRALQRTFANPDYSSLRLLSIDEISYKKRHQYLTLVLDLERTRVIWVGKGRSQATLEGFFDEIGEENAQGIEAIAVDMWDPYLAAIEAKSPQANVVFDKFHIIRNYSKVIDRVRNDEVKKAEKEDKPILRGTKYLLLKNWENLSERQQSRLDTLLSLNNNLNVAYVLKEDLKRLWDCKDQEEAQQVLAEWTQTAEESGIKALIGFARMLNRYAFGLFNHCEYPISNATLEGFNNKIKVIKRRCYGFHDLEYFTLKIKQAVNLDHPPW
jgi:transposase